MFRLGTVFWIVALLVMTLLFTSTAEAGCLGKIFKGALGVVTFRGVREGRAARSGNYGNSYSNSACVGAACAVPVATQAPQQMKYSHHQAPKYQNHQAPAPKEQYPPVPVRPVPQQSLESSEPSSPPNTPPAYPVQGTRGALPGAPDRFSGPR